MDSKYLFIGFIILVIFIVLLKNIRPKSKGQIGEKLVNNILKKLPNNYIVIKNILLKTNVGTSQIDHIVVCKKGIFVIETKNYSGLIYGDEKQKYWVQIIGKSKNKFFNPIWQNRGHINAVKNSISYKKVPIYSIVVFCGNCTLKSISSNSYVIYAKELNRTIKKTKSNINLSRQDVEEIVDMLNDKNIMDKKMLKKHVKFLKSREKNTI